MSKFGQNYIGITEITAFFDQPDTPGEFIIISFRYILMIIWDFASKAAVLCAQ